VRRSIELLQAVLDGTTDVIFVKDLAGKYLFINRIGAQLVGKHVEEVVGHDDYHLFSPETSAAIRRIDEQVVRESRSITYEQTGPPLARDHTFLVTKSPYQNAAGEIAGIIGIARDISPQKRAAEVLTDSARRFSTLADNSPTGIYEADADGNCIYVNNKCCELFEVPRAQLLRQEGWNAIHPDDLAWVTERWNRFVSSDDASYHAEFRFLFPEERIKHIVGTALPLYDEQRRRTGFIGNIMDVTAQRLAQRALEVANQELEARVQARTGELISANEQLRHEMAERVRTQERLREQQAQLAHALRVRTLGEMAAELAHEVNQPLSAISNYVHGTQQKLKAGSLTRAEIESTLEIISRESQRAADVIRRTKRFASTHKPTSAPLDLHKLIHEALEMLAYKVREQDIKVTLDLAEGIPLGAGDELQVQQVIVNLLRNAIEAIAASQPAERQMTIATRHEASLLNFSVEDSGAGLQLVQQERIFEAFYTTRPQGLGLGLPISRAIIEAHGGRLWADVACARGARFRFTLPVWDDAPFSESASRTDHFRSR
jgi:PAS domain S-box-containing protein